MRTAFFLLNAMVVFSAVFFVEYKPIKVIAIVLGTIGMVLSLKVG